MTHQDPPVHQSEPVHQDEPLHESDDFKETAYEQPLPPPSKCCRYCGEAITSGDICPKCKLTHDEQKYPNDDVIDRDYDDDHDQEKSKYMHHLASPNYFHESKSRYLCHRGMSNEKKMMYAIAIAVGLLMPIAFVYMMPYLLYMPSTVAYKHGPFQVNSLHFVDGNDGTEYAGVEYFELYVSNNSERYDEYNFITNGTGSVSQVLAALASIPESEYYLQVVLYSDGYAPYGDSWDIITTGNNWIYLYPIP
jgi:hypothetical protein